MKTIGTYTLMSIIVNDTKLRKQYKRQFERKQSEECTRQKKNNHFTFISDHVYIH